MEARRHGFTLLLSKPVRHLLVIGYWLLVIGYWLLVIGLPKVKCDRRYIYLLALCGEIARIRPAPHSYKPQPP